MGRYVLRRLLLMVPTLFGITLICFAILHLADADPVTADLHGGLRSGRISQEAIAHLRATYDLDQPWYVQYGALVRRLLTLDLGNTWRDGRPIREVIGEALPITLILSFLSLVLSYAIAIPLGVYSAVHRRGRLDRVTTLALFLLYSLPTFWAGTLLLELVPSQGWHRFQGFDALGPVAKAVDVAAHLVLPLLVLAYPALASLSRYMRSGMLDTIRQDYVRTARAKGLPERAVVWRHAFRNAILPIVTLLGMFLPHLIGGSVVVEVLFGLRGMGGLAFEAIRMPDYPLVVTLVAFTAVLTMAGLLVSDVLYALVDPRIQLGRRR